jgi:iron(III) transport system ATP-binding protein
VGLAGFEHRLPSELSGGQQQRVAVARAIVLEPKVLLFDEPLSNLDARLRRHVRDEIRALQQSLKLSVVYVTHDQEEALAVSDRIIVMNAARIAQDGTPRELFEAPASRFIANFIGDANFMPVEILRITGDQATIQLGGTTVDLPHRGLPPGPAALAIRPRALRLLRHAPEVGQLACRVRKSAYLGTHMEYEVHIEGIAEDLFVIDPDVADPLPPDATASVAFVTSAITLVPAA